MKTASVSKLKATLSEFLARVKTGEEVIVTERGKPIAKIVPFTQDASKLSPHMEELARLGLARVGSCKLPDGFWKIPRPTDKTGAAAKAFEDERATGR